MKAQELSSFLDQHRILLLIQLPELGVCLPRLEMNVPDGLSMSIVDADTGVSNLLFIARLAGIRVDVM
jgi:hypothetical protein